MTKIKLWIIERPYTVAGVIFLALAFIGVSLFGWWKDELRLLLILYIVAILGIRLDEIARKIGIAEQSHNPHSDQTGTILSKLDLSNLNN